MVYLWKRWSSSWKKVSESGYILYTGTQSQLDEFLLGFSDDEFKVRGVFEYKSTEYYMFKYGPLYDVKKDENVRSDC